MYHSKHGESPRPVSFYQEAVNTAPCQPSFLPPFLPSLLPLLPSIHLFLRSFLHSSLPPSHPPCIFLPNFLLPFSLPIHPKFDDLDLLHFHLSAALWPARSDVTSCEASSRSFLGPDVAAAAGLRRVVRTPGGEQKEFVEEGGNESLWGKYSSSSHRVKGQPWEGVAVKRLLFTAAGD